MNPFDQFDEATTGNPFDQFDTPAPAAGIQAKDLAVSLKQGVQRLPSMLAGLADIPLAVAGLNRPMSRLADLAGEVTGFQPEKWAKEADAQHSPGYHAQQAALGNAWKDSGADDLSRTLFSPEEWDKLGQKWDALDGKSLAKEIVQNPGAVGSMAVESLPGMLTGGLIGKGVKTAAGLAGLEGLAGSSIGAAATRAGIGEGSVTAGQVMSQIDPRVNPLTAAGAATGAGVVTGLVGGTSGRIAAKLGLPDLEMAMAGAKGGSPLSLLQRLPASMAQEGLLEEMPQSMQEQVWQNAAEGKPLGEGVLRSGVDGMLAGMTTGGVFSALPQRAPAGPPPGPLTQAASLAPRVPEPTAPDPGAIDLSAMSDAAGVMPAGSAGAPPGQGVEPATSIAPGAPAIWRYDNVDHPVEVVAVMPHQGMDGRQYVKVQGVVNGTQQTDVVPIDELVTAGQQDQVLSGAAPGWTVAPSSPEATIPQPGVPEASGLSAPDTGSMPQRPAGPGVNLDALFVEQTQFR